MKVQGRKKSNICIGSKEVDTVLYQPVRLEFFVLVNEPVPKHLQNVPLKIPTYTRQNRRIGQYWTFRPEKRNSTGTKTERKNRRNAWFEQTQCSKLPPHWHRRLDLLLPFFFSSFSHLLSLSIALISSLFLLNNEYCYVISLFLFGILFEIS